MEEQSIPPAEPATPMSFIERVTNVFAAPGEAFENVRLTGPTATNWLLPYLIFIIVAIAMGQLLLNNPALVDQLGATIRKGIEQQVQEGKMTQDRADQVYDQFARPGSTWFVVTQIGAITFGSLLALFLIGLIYWMLGKSVMKATVPYMKVIEVLGLSMFLIGAVEQIVTMMFMYLFDSIHATPSLALFVADFDIHNKLHLALSKINAFTCWWLIVFSIGLSKLFQRDFPKVLVLTIALWVLWSLVTIFAGIRF